MAKDTNRRIKANLRNPEFKKRLEEAKGMVQQGKNADAAYHILKHMNLKKDENNPFLFNHIPDRQLAEMLGIPNPEGKRKTAVFNARKRLKKERFGTTKNNQRNCVYILTNPSMPGLIKIGKTEKTAHERAEELYTTGVPEPFSIAYSIPSQYPEILEGILHKKFKQYRTNKDREFFKYSADKVIEWLKNRPSSIGLYDIEAL
ncbi:GIY-YIG nuclease family protein [Candidatus Poribacteria bacterium]|nr:GIY-YIG nuclease family protein [Candidatus Poribacteria bacterium]